MATKLLLDGYNVLHATGLARRTYGPGDLERSRGRLLTLLAGFLTEQERTTTLIVFDAQDSPSYLGGQETHEGIAVLYPPHSYSKADGDADAYIETFIRKHSAPKQLRVISSDRRIQHAAKKRRCQIQDSERFLRDLKTRVSSETDPPTKADPPEVSEAEVEFWKDELGDLLE